MRVISAAEVDAALDFSSLIAALKAAFSGNIVVPVRHHHTVERDGAQAATHLLMPAWTRGTDQNYLGTKIVNVFPDNGKKGLPSIYGTYLLMSGETGETLAAIDGTRLTAWRTAAASALASDFLASKDASRMVMIGAGALAPFLIRAHATVRPIRHVTLWNQNRQRAEALQKSLADSDLEILVTEDLEQAVRDADIISAATLSSAPLVRGDWLKAGSHVDLVGAYSAGMRESDDACMQKARIFVDTRGGALKEGGDIVQAIASGAITADNVIAELAELCRGDVHFQRQPHDITLFKSVGTAIEDIAAAMLVWQRSNADKT
jgi:ornithine cyclodeaminase/alanine dehydrogenase-like protein (mu-crystallin family)